MTVVDDFRAGERNYKIKKNDKNNDWEAFFHRS